MTEKKGKKKVLDHGMMPGDKQTFTNLTPEQRRKAAIASKLARASEFDSGRLRRKRYSWEKDS